MRQPQQNKRMRGRGRKPSNSSNRVHESNGPDVKVRGSASHVAEKYVSLARDATVAGDRIIAENYLQHAEHYFRIVAIAQSQQTQNQNTQGQHQQNQHTQNARHNPAQPGNESAKSMAENQENTAQPADQDMAVDQEAAAKTDQPSDFPEKEKGDGESRPNRPHARTRRPRKPDVASAADTPDNDRPAEKVNQEKTSIKADKAPPEETQEKSVAEDKPVVEGNVQAETTPPDPEADSNSGSEPEETAVIA